MFRRAESSKILPYQFVFGRHGIITAWKALTAFLLVISGLGLFLFAPKPAWTSKSRLATLTALSRSTNKSLRYDTSRTSQTDLPSYCNTFDLSVVAITVKTGSTVAFEKLTAQLLTCLSCVPEPLIFSDLDQTLGRQQIYDIISQVSPQVMENNPNFDIYLKLKELVSQGRGTDLETLGSVPIHTSDWRSVSYINLVFRHDNKHDHKLKNMGVIC